MTRATTRGWAGVFLAATLTAVALPVTALEAPRDYAGDWTLAGLSEGAEVCDVILTDDPAIGGWSVQLAADCQDKFVLPEDIAAWTVLPGGAVAFINPLRQVLLRFEPAEIGGYVAQPAAGEPIALDRANAQPELTEQQRMTGVWTLTELGGTPTCRLQVTAAADGLSGKLRRLETCRAPWIGADLAGWRRTGDKIILLSRRGKPVATLSGDSFDGFGGERNGVYVGFIRQWDDH